MGKEVRKTARQVIAEVAERHNMTMAAMLGDSRKRADAWPRQEAMYEVFVQCPHLSFKQIARAMGGRDHSTIITGVKKHCARIGQSYEWLRFVAGRPDKYSIHRVACFSKAATIYGDVMTGAMHHGH